MDNVDIIKIKNFCSVKDNVKRIRRHATYWGKIFVKDISNKRLLYKMYKELVKLNSMKTNNLIKKWAKDHNRYFTKEDIQMENKHMLMLN